MKVYDVFIEGAKEGFDVAMKIIPFLVGILVAIGMFRASGAMELLLAALRPAAAATGFPAELIPLAILRSLSGSGSLALTTDLIKTHGPDSLMARMAATMYGSSETTFYVLAVYFGAVGVQAHAGTRCLRRSSATWSRRSRRWPSACGCSRDVSQLPTLQARQRANGDSQAPNSRAKAQLPTRQASVRCWTSGVPWELGVGAWELTPIRNAP